MLLSPTEELIYGIPSLVPRPLPFLVASSITSDKSWVGPGNKALEYQAFCLFQCLFSPPIHSTEHREISSTTL